MPIRPDDTEIYLNRSSEFCNHQNWTTNFNLTKVNLPYPWHNDRSDSVAVAYNKAKNFGAKRFLVAFVQYQKSSTNHG